MNLDLESGIRPALVLAEAGYRVLWCDHTRLEATNRLHTARAAGLTEGAQQVSLANGRERVSYGNGGALYITSKGAVAGRGVSVDIVFVHPLAWADVDTRTSLIPCVATHRSELPWAGSIFTLMDRVV